MSTPFDPKKRLIALPVRLVGPTGDYYALLALDTGASATIVSRYALRMIGYTPDAFPKTVRFTTGSGVETAARFPIGAIEALEQSQSNFTVVAHDLPSLSSVEGVLCLDFLRSHILTVDFRKGEITLS